MSRPEQDVVQHFTHIHPLMKVSGYGEFTCGGCKTFGFGKTYRCAWCDYNLHDHCATCPPTLPSFMHPQHELRLVFMGPEQTHQNRRMCDICDESAEGLYYQCEPCGFDIHPLCTQLSQHVRHVHHPTHLLELSHCGASSMCMVCRGANRSWRYKCGPCGLDVHMECIDSSASVAVTTIQQRGFGSQQQFHSSQYHQPYYNHGYNYGYTNQGQVQEPRPSTGRRMFKVLMALTVGVVCISSLVRPPMPLSAAFEMARPNDTPLYMSFPLNIVYVSFLSCFMNSQIVRVTIFSYTYTQIYYIITCIQTS